MTALATLPEGDSVAFTALSRDLDMTVGNLSTHLSRLETGGYVDITKTFVGRKPATFVHLTDVGRRAFGHYLTELRTLLKELP